MSFTRFFAIAGKEFVQLRRDKFTFGMIVGIPIIQLLLFGFAINTDVRHIPMVVVDEDVSAVSRDTVRSLEISGTFEVVGNLSSRTEIAEWFRRGDAQVALVIPTNYFADLSRAAPVQVQLIVDGSDPQVVSAALGAAAGFFESRQQSLQALRLLPPRGAQREVRYVPAVWYNPELRSAVFIVPGLIGTILTMTLMMFTAMGITRERERGTLEQLIVSPVKRFELIAGKIAPYVVIGYIQMTLILLLGYLVFDVPVRGSPLTLYIISFEFISANLALGIFISTVATTQQQAMQMSFFFFLPSMLLSGFMFPFGAMPELAQHIGNAIPLTHFLRIVRGVVLRGSGIGDLVPEMLSLAVITAVLVALATMKFHKSLD